MATFEQRLERLEKMVEERLEQVEERLERFEKMMADVSMGQTRGFEDIVCKSLTVVRADGNPAVFLGDGDAEGLGGILLVWSRSSNISTQYAKPTKVLAQ